MQLLGDYLRTIRRLVFLSRQSQRGRSATVCPAIRSTPQVFRCHRLRQFPKLRQTRRLRKLRASLSLRGAPSHRVQHTRNKLHSATPVGPALLKKTFDRVSHSPICRCDKPQDSEPKRGTHICHDPDTAGIRVAFAEEELSCAPQFWCGCVGGGTRCRVPSVRYPCGSVRTVQRLGLFQEIGRPAGALGHSSASLLPLQGPRVPRSLTASSGMSDK